jgi:dCTP deaminase
MILTDREIKASLASGLIIIEPHPGEDAYESTSVDLTLDPTLRIFRETAPGLSVAIDPGLPGYKARDLIAGVTEPFPLNGKGFDLEPKKLVLGWTKERIELPLHGRVAARVEGKSGLARVGLAIHCTAPTIHAGFVGTIQLEIVNHGPMPIRLRPNIPICQLIFEQTLGTADAGYKGQFAGQTAR